MKKGKHDVAHLPFIRLAKEILFKCPEWWNLSPGSRDIYMLLKAKYNGANNGEIRLYYSEVKVKRIRGLKSDRTISTAFQELESEGWIERTHVGGLHRFKNDYRLTGKWDRLV